MFYVHTYVLHTTKSYACALIIIFITLLRLLNTQQATIVYWIRWL